MKDSFKQKNSTKSQLTLNPIFVKSSPLLSRKILYLLLLWFSHLLLGGGLILLLLQIFFTVDHIFWSKMGRLKKFRTSKIIIRFRKSFIFFHNFDEDSNCQDMRERRKVRLSYANVT